MRVICTAVIALFMAASSLVAQPRPVSPANSYERVLCVVPIVGSGTKADPMRPLYAPVRQRGADVDEEGIVAFVSYPSDDGKFALVEFVAKNKTAFDRLFEEKRPDVKIFVRGKARKQDIEREFRKHALGFNLENFEVVLP